LPLGDQLIHRVGGMDQCHYQRQYYQHETYQQQTEYGFWAI
jgi:hypothetical protein